VERLAWAISALDVAERVSLALRWFLGLGENAFLALEKLDVVSRPEEVPCCSDPW